MAKELCLAVWSPALAKNGSARKHPVKEASCTIYLGKVCNIMARPVGNRGRQPPAQIRLTLPAPLPTQPPPMHPLAYPGATGPGLRSEPRQLGRQGSARAHIILVTQLLFV